MPKEMTLGIIKPDGVARNLIGEVLSRVERSGLKIVSLGMMRLNRKQAEGFYAVHKGKSFFNSLVDFMTSGPVVPFIIEAENAIATWRDLMGKTNPKDAAPGTIRNKFGEGIERNTVHGSDSPQTASFEIGYFFSDNGLLKNSGLTRDAT